MVRFVPSGHGLRSTLLAIILLTIVVGLVGAPFLFADPRVLDTAAVICIFIVVLASYDLLLGYAGIVSLAHILFFGFGAYGTALATIYIGPSFGALATGALLSAVSAAGLAAAMALIALRGRTIHFTLISLVVAIAVVALVSQDEVQAGDESGVTLLLPQTLKAEHSFEEEPISGIALSTWPAITTGALRIQESLHSVPLNGELARFYLIFGVSLVCFLALLGIVKSPFGNTLSAKGETVEGAGGTDRTIFRCRVGAICLSAVFAAAAGSLFAIWARDVDLQSTLSFELMLIVLLLSVAGGMGSLYGAVISATVYGLVRDDVQSLLLWGRESVPDVWILPALFDPDRWLLWAGMLLVLSVYLLPKGIVGQLRGQRN